MATWIPTRARSRMGSALLVPLLALSLLPLFVPAAVAQPTSFTFAAAGDIGGDSAASASLTKLAQSATDFAFALGDLSYNEITPESAWCDFVKARVGATYPFELIAGNHEDNGPDGLITNFAACLSDRLGGLVGTYAREYYVDYPSSLPLARMIMISPDLTFSDGSYSYAAGTAHRTWLANAIDGARASGIR